MKYDKMSRISKSVETGNRLVRGWERGEGKQNGECLLISTRFLLGVDENVLKFENLALELEYCPTLWIYKNIRLYTLKWWDFMVYELYFNKKNLIQMFLIWGRGQWKPLLGW